MKRITAILLLAGAAAVLCSNARAERQTIYPFYVKFDAGGSWTPDLSLKQTFSPALPGGDVKFDDAGYRFGFSGGWQFTDMFSAEASVGYSSVGIKSIPGATYIDNANYANVPFMVNARFQLPNRTRFTPYVGAGVGFSTAIFDANAVEFGRYGGIHGNDADAVFAWQAFGGVRYDFSDEWGLCLEYRYLWVDSASWNAVTPGPFGPIESTALAFGQSQTHSISLAVEFRF